MKRRLPRVVKEEYAHRAVVQGVTRKTASELLHVWISAEKRRTHKRERREGKKELNE